MKLSLFSRWVGLVLPIVVVLGCSADAKRNRALQQAGAHFKAGEYEKARLEYLTILRQAPDNADAIEHLGRIFVEQGAPLRAVPFFNKIRSVSPEKTEVRLLLGRIFLSIGKVDDARREVLAVLERSPGNPEAVILLTEAVRTMEDFRVADLELKKITLRNSAAALVASANLARFGGDAATARANLKRAVTAEPKYPAAHTALAEILVILKSPAEAAAEFKLAAELSPVRSSARMRHAEFLAQQGGAAEAVTSLQEITRQAPDYLPAWRKLAQIAMAQGKYDEALGHLKTVFGRDAGDYESLVLRAQIALLKGDARAAIAELERVAQTFPNLSMDKYHLAMAWLQLNEPGRAIEALRLCVAQDPDNLEALFLLSRLSLRAGGAEPVAGALKDLLNRRPAPIQAHLLLIEAMKALGRLDELVRDFGESIKNSPRNPQAHFLLGLVFTEQRKFAAARESLNASLALLPNQTQVKAELVNLDFKEGKLAAALAGARELKALAPDSAPFHFLEARALAALGQWAEMEAVVTRVLELDPKFEAAYGLLAETFGRRMKQAGSAAPLEAYLATRPTDTMATLVAGQVLTQAGEFGKARDVYEKFLVARPNSSVVLNNLAELYDDHLNQSDRALELARKARQLDPASPAVADTLGWILFKRREYPEAVEVLKESATRAPNEPVVQYHLGMASQAAGQIEAARAAFDRAVKAAADFPGKSDAVRRLAELGGPLPAVAVPAAPAADRK